MTSTQPRGSFLIDSLLEQHEKFDETTCSKSIDLIQPIKDEEINNATKEQCSNSRIQNGKFEKGLSKGLNVEVENERLENRPITIQPHLQRLFANFTSNCQRLPSRYVHNEQAQQIASYNLNMLSRYLNKYQMIQNAALQWSSALSNAESLQRAIAASPYINHTVPHLHGFSDGRMQRSRIDNAESSATSSTASAAQIKKYRCDICEKTFSRSNTLITHKVQQFVMTEHYYHIFGECFGVYQTNLQRIHTGEKPFQCDHCGRAFRQPGNLTRHRFTHTTVILLSIQLFNVKPYVCSLCEKAFNRASNLHTHMRTHTQLSNTPCSPSSSTSSSRIISDVIHRDIFDPNSGNIPK
ncbi:unnamed protein product [Anisakis simplex]|uniref:C2H2-type domain-containing protein n=1 Tax=Anisakis simplex TaxID=6269 RepID=A0A158PNZ8_ANISI|nr:unnamed protein product [Anisakis simplex]